MKIIKCPRCGKSNYTCDEKRDIIGDTTLFYFSCNKCSTNLKITVEDCNAFFFNTQEELNKDYKLTYGN